MSKRDQLILLGIVAAAALAAFYIGLLKPELAKSKQLGSQLAAAQASRTSALAAVASARTAEAAYHPNLAAINATQTAIPPTDKTSSLLDQLDAAARRSGVDFSTITLSASSTGAAASTPPPAATGSSSTAGGSSAGGSTAAGNGSSAGASPAGAGGQAAPAAGVGAAALSVPPGYSAAGAAGLPTVSYSLDFTGNYLKLQKFLAAMQHFVAIRNGQIHAHGRLIDVQGVSVGQGNVSMSVVAYLLAPADQAPLPVPGRAAASIPAVGHSSPASPAAAAATTAAVTGGTG